MAPLGPVLIGVEIVMNILAAAILAVSVFTSPVETLVLTTGEQIPVTGEVQVRDGQVIFRHENGSLYSVALAEVDVRATEKAGSERSGRPRSSSSAERAPSPLQELRKAAADRSIAGRQIVVSEEEKQRLLAELSRSRGTPRALAPLSSDSVGLPQVPAPTVSVEPRNDEQYWRERSRQVQEQVRQRKEDLQLLIDREQGLQDEILGLLSLGYKGDQFGYQVMSLARTRDAIPQAKLELERAERAQSQFMDDARRQGILPGWLRD